MNNRNLTYAFVIVTVFLSGCATHRLGQFEKFSKAGMEYAHAMIVLSEEAGKIAIDADSQKLMTVRSGFLPSEVVNCKKTKGEEVKDDETRKHAYSIQTLALEGYLEELRNFRMHTRLLQKYFSSLNKLASSDIASGVSGNTGQLIEELEKISPSLREAKIRGNPIKKFINETVERSVSSFQQKALEKELKNNATTIERELELQHAYLTVLAIGIEEDLETIIDTKTFYQVEKPYTGRDKLPKNWLNDRRNLMSSKIMIGSIDNAKNAAKQLKSAFVDLVENKIEAEDLNALFRDINNILDLIEVGRSTMTE